MVEGILLVNWTELVLTLKGKKLLSNLYADRSVKLRTDEEEPRIVNTGIGVRQACRLLSILFTLYIQYLTK